MDETVRQAGEPYCGNCGHALTGLTESSKCPECGKPLVEVLMRPSIKLTGGRRYRSKTMLWGLPLLDVAFGASGTDRYGKARGFIALGDVATGVVAAGGRATGVVAAGGMATGVFSMGGMSVGLLNSVGGLSIGGLATGGWAMGGLVQGGGAAGFAAQGGMAFGYYVRAGGAFGVHRIAPGGTTSQQAVDFFDAFSWFFAEGPSVGEALGAFGMVFLINLAAAAFFLGIAWLKHARSGSDTPGAPGHL